MYNDRSSRAGLSGVYHAADDFSRTMRRELGIRIFAAVDHIMQATSYKRRYLRSDRPEQVAGDESHRSATDPGAPPRSRP